jgi:hypothetical protein
MALAYNSELPNWIDDVIFLYVRPSSVTFVPSIWLGQFVVFEAVMFML